MIAVVAVVVAGATGAFFSDTETSTGNTFTAGAIDLGVDNHSYYNGVLNPGTTWRVDYDLSDEIPRQFFNFLDLKPGDWGEDTISLHVNNNDSYLCADVTLTSNNDNSSTEPELDENGEIADDSQNSWDGELANSIKWYWWADDGDNVYEEDEDLLPGSGYAFPNATGPYSSTVALADSQTNVWGDQDQTGAPSPLPGDSVRFIAKAWCFGDTVMEAYYQDDGNNQSGPDDRPVTCSGVNESNITQTDGLTMDVSFRAVQSRNNDGFLCDDRDE